jgi:hypothetical protein
VIQVRICNKRRSMLKFSIPIIWTWTTLVEHRWAFQEN